MGSRDEEAEAALKDQEAMRLVLPQPSHALKVNSVSSDIPGVCVGGGVRGDA